MKPVQPYYSRPEILIQIPILALWPRPHGSRELLVFLTWESFDEDACGVVIGVDLAVLDDPPCVKVAAVVIAHINVVRTSLGDPGGDFCQGALRIGVDR